MIKIGVFGGTFNPIHTEHVNLIKSAIKELGLDKLFVVPDNFPPHKDIVPAPNLKRLQMIKLAIKDLKKAEVSDFELLNGGKSYSYLTVEHFKAVYSDSRIFFIVGGDMLFDFENWKFPERILQNATLVAAFRKGEKNLQSAKENFFKRFNEDFIELKFCGKAVSSTEIRTYASLGLPIDEFVPNTVSRYIMEEKLYCDKYSDFVKNNLPESRRIHTAGVVCAALSKVKDLNLNADKVRLAAILHDCAKYLNKEDYKDFLLPGGVPQPVEHAFLGAYIAEHVLGIEDVEVLDAIKFHTSGKANMSILAKLIFVADMVEKNRTYDGVEKLKCAFKKNFNQCFLLCLKEEMAHLQKREVPIYEETIKAFDYYIKNAKHH